MKIEKFLTRNNSHCSCIQFNQLLYCRKCIPIIKSAILRIIVIFLIHILLYTVYILFLFFISLVWARENDSIEHNSGEKFFFVVLSDCNEFAYQVSASSISKRRVPLRWCSYFYLNRLSVLTFICKFCWSFVGETVLSNYNCTKISGTGILLLFLYKSHVDIFIYYIYTHNKSWNPKLFITKV